MTLTYRWTEGSIPPPGHYSRGVRVAADGTGGAWLKAGYGSAPVFEADLVVDAEPLAALWAALDAAGLWDEWARPERRSIGGSHWRLTATDGDRTAEVRGDATGPDGQSPRPLRDAAERVVPDAVWADLRAQRAAFLKAP